MRREDLTGISATLLDMAPTAFFQTSVQGELLKVNKTCSDMFGYASPADMVEKITDLPRQMYIDPEQRKEFVNSIGRNGEVSAKPITFRHRDGSPVWGLITARIVRDVSGAPYIYEGFIQDDGERRRAIQNLVESERLHRDIIDTVPDPIFIHCEELILFANRTAVEMLGYHDMKKVLGRNLLEMTCPLYMDRARQRFSNASKGIRLGYAEYEMTMPDGRTKGMAARTVPIVYKGRDALLSIAKDLTEQRKTELALRHAEQNYQALVESAPVGIGRTTADGRFINANDKLAEIYGYSSPEQMLSEVTDIPNQLLVRPETYRHICRLAEKHGKLRDFEILNRRKSGRVIWTLCNVRAVPLHSGDESHFQFFVLDITARKKAEEETWQKNRLLRSLTNQLTVVEERERKRIASDLHDGVLQTLALAQIKLEGLRSQASGKDDFEAPLNLLRQAIGDARAVLDELSPPVLYELKFVDAIKWLAEQFGDQHGLAVEVVAQKKHLDLSNDMRAFLYRAVRELLVNVVKHAKALEATITIQNREGPLRIVVDDDGAGMPLEVDIHKKFSCHGLAHMAERLANLGGEMDMESKPGKGTRVILQLPAAVLTEEFPK